MEEKSTILVIDDEKTVRESCFQILDREGYSVLLAEDGIAGTKMLKDKKPDTVIVDLKMPGMSGIEVIEKIISIDPGMVIIVITGYATISSAVESMKQGAYDFLPKPFTPDELRIVVRRGLEKRRLVKETALWREEMKKIRKKFVTLVSHQLRTPLISIKQYFEAILSGAVGETNPKQEKIFHFISERISGLLGLIDNWLCFSRIETGKLVDRFTDVSLKPALEEITKSFAGISGARGISITKEFRDGNCVVKGDEKALREMFSNLVDNAVKYNKKNGRIDVKLFGDKTHYIVEVSDTGTGISEESLPFIFDEFFQEYNRDKSNIAGNGLGLSIAKKIVDAHSGYIKVESKPGEGSKFRVFLPF